ncbi:hypothetical protein ACDW39_18335|uniref:hypothetical protein n=1 Tax=Clostridioides difficile TaxID=1496 RepID=UPI003556070B
MKIIEGIKKYSNTDRTALMCNGDKLSYKDLNEYSDAISVFSKGCIQRRRYSYSNLWK